VQIIPTQDDIATRISPNFDPFEERGNLGLVQSASRPSPRADDRFTAGLPLKVAKTPATGGKLPGQRPIPVRRHPDLV
jgi:hypothetical protein